MGKKYRDHTVQDIIDHTRRNVKLTPRQISDRCSSLRTLARGLGRSPCQIPGSMSHLRQLTKNKSHVSFGCSKKRFQNILSDVTAAAHDYCGSTPAKQLTDEWTVIIEAIEDKGERTAISSFARFCSSHSWWRLAMR